MKKQALWRISVSTTPEAEDAVSELLQTIFEQPASSYTNLKTGKIRVSLFLEHKPDWSKTARARLQAQLSESEHSSLPAAASSLALARVRAEHWAESWKKHFKPIIIGSRLIIRPSWSHRRAREGQVLVVLDPGLSFGTGQHPTTAFCLKQIVARTRPGRKQGLLDVGTGSGILAICGAKLGYAPVDAFDFDPESVRIARVNARLNGVDKLMKVQRQDLTKLGNQPRKTYALICANLLSTLLVQQRERLIARLGDEGLIVLAGILHAEFPAVQRAYEAGGMRLIASRRIHEWHSGAFELNLSEV